jgi:hypothetical protein
VVAFIGRGKGEYKEKGWEKGKEREREKRGREGKRLSQYAIVYIKGD